MTIARELDSRIFFEHSPYATNENFVKENRVLKHKYAQMKHVAAKERSEKNHFKERCIQLERTVISMQPQQAHMFPGPSFISRVPTHTPTHSHLLAAMPRTSSDAIVEKSSIESIEVPDYLK